MGIAALLYLKARGYDVMVITEDENVEWVARRLGVPIFFDFNIIGKINYDLFLCVHGRKIIPTELLTDKMVNIHPTDYNGHNPVKRYIESGDIITCIRSMYMTEEVDEGENIVSVVFSTGVVKTYAEFYNIALIHYYRILEETLKIVL